MARVNVITRITKEKSPAKMQRVGMWLVEVIKDTYPETIQGFLQRESITGQELTLQLLCNAVSVVKKLNIDFESIAIYSDCEPVSRAFLNKWLEKWAVEDWKTSKGKEIADDTTWMLLWKLLNESGKRYILCDTKSSYHNWMATQIEKEMEKIKDIEAADAAVKKLEEILA